MNIIGLIIFNLHCFQSSISMLCRHLYFTGQPLPLKAIFLI